MYLMECGQVMLRESVIILFYKGSWIEVRFNKDYQITKLEYKNREN